MPRVHNVWIVTYVGVPVATFTVKHELAYWLKTQSDRHRLLIYRLQDGGKAAHKLYSYKDFE